MEKLAWGCNSVVEYFPSVPKALESILKAARGETYFCKTTENQFL